MHIFLGMNRWSCDWSYLLVRIIDASVTKMKPHLITSLTWVHFCSRHFKIRQHLSSTLPKWRPCKKNSDWARLDILLHLPKHIDTHLGLNRQWSSHFPRKWWCKWRETKLFSSRDDWNTSSIVRRVLMMVHIVRMAMIDAKYLQSKYAYVRYRTSSARITDRWQLRMTSKMDACVPLVL